MARLTIYDVCQKLENTDLTELKKPGRNKGERGQSLELTLGLQNSSALTDLKDGDIKTFTIGQTIAVTQLNHCLSEIITHKTSFQDSKVGIKIRNTIYIAFQKDGKFRSWKCVLNYHSLIDKFAEDYKYIANAVSTSYETKVVLHTVTGPNKILQIRTKATKTKNGSYVPMVYEGVKLSNKGMAFYITARFIKSVF